jgi:hypothetical protein
MDGLTRTTLQFDTNVSDNAFTKTIEALHRVPGVLFTETSVGIRRALVAHDGGVAIASLIGAATGAGASVRIVVTAGSKSETPAKSVAARASWMSYAAPLFAIVCLVLFSFKILTQNELQWIAPLFLLVVLVDSIVRRRRP